MTDMLDLDGRIDDIVASCNGNLHGALKALMLVNEQLERELQRVTALAIYPVAPAISVSALH